MGPKQWRLGDEQPSIILRRVLKALCQPPWCAPQPLHCLCAQRAFPFSLFNFPYPHTLLQLRHSSILPVSLFLPSPSLISPPLITSDAVGAPGLLPQPPPPLSSPSPPSHSHADYSAVISTWREAKRQLARGAQKAYAHALHLTPWAGGGGGGGGNAYAISEHPFPIAGLKESVSASTSGGVGATVTRRSSSGALWADMALAAKAVRDSGFEGEVPASGMHRDKSGMDG